MNREMSLNSVFSRFFAIFGVCRYLQFTADICSFLRILTQKCKQSANEMQTKKIGWMIGKKHKSNHPAVKGVPIRKRTAKWSGKRRPAVTHDRPREEYKSKWTLFNRENGTILWS